MKLHHAIVESCGYAGIYLSGVRVYCQNNNKTDISRFFIEQFLMNYQKLMDEIKETYGDCYELDNSVNPLIDNETTTNGLLFRFSELSLSYADGDRVAEQSGTEAIIASLDAVRAVYPGITYDGYIGYRWFDVHGGDVFQLEISSEEKEDVSDKTYDFVGLALSEAVQNDDFWEEMEENLFDATGDDFDDILSCLKMYNISESSYERLNEIMENADALAGVFSRLKEI